MENKDKNENEQLIVNEVDKNLNKIKEEKKNMKMAVMLGIFVAMIFLIGSLITLALVAITSRVYKTAFNDVISCMQAKDYFPYYDQTLKACAISQGYGNLISYAILTILIILLLKDTIVEDFKRFKSMKIGVIGFLAGAGFLATTIIIESIIGLFAKDTQNQASIEMIMKNGGLIPMVICTVFLAPFVEEFVYRKIIFHFTSKYSKLASYILSIVFFSLPHVLTSMSNGITVENVLQLIPYAYAGFIFAVVYDKSEENLFASLTLHFFNNLYSAISVIIYYGIQVH